MAAIAAGVLIALLVVSSVIGFLLKAAIAALVAVVVLAIKVTFYRGQLSSKGPDSEVREPRYNSPLPRHDARDVDDELARLKREMSG